MALAEELGWSVEGFREAFAELFREGLAKADWSARVVWIPNAVRYNQPENPNVVKGWRIAWDEVPECPLKTEAYERFKEFTKGLGEGFGKAFVDGCVKGLANQEQEQEPEQEPKKPMSKPDGFDAAVKEVWDYYKKALNRAEWTELTDKRKRIASARMRELYVKAAEPKLENIVKVMKIAVDRLKDSKFHNGGNDSGNRYVDWEILFRSREQFEKWISDDNFSEGAA